MTSVERSNVEQLTQKTFTVELTEADIKNLLVAVDQAGQKLGLQSFAVMAALAEKLSAPLKTSNEL